MQNQAAVVRMFVVVTAEVRRRPVVAPAPTCVEVQHVIRRSRVDSSASRNGAVKPSFLKEQVVKKAKACVGIESNGRFMRTGAGGECRRQAWAEALGTAQAAGIDCPFQSQGVGVNASSRGGRTRRTR